MGSVERDDEWEYVAPQYVDFSTNPLEDKDNPDAWFDCPSICGIEEEFLDEDEDYNVCSGVDVIEDAEVVGAEDTASPKEETRRLTRSFASTPVNEKGMPEASDTKKTPAQGTPRKTPRRTPRTHANSNIAASPEVTEVKDEIKEDKSTELASGKNICTDLAQWRAKSTKDVSQTSKNNSKPQPTKVKKLPTTGAEAIQKEEPRSRSASLKRSRSFRRSADTTNLSSSMDGKSTGGLKRTNSMKRSISQTLTNNTSGSSFDNNSKRQHSRGHSRGHSSGRANSTDRQTRQRSSSTSSDTKDDQKPSKMPKLTFPTTPSFMKRAPATKVNGEQYKKAEDRELEKIALMRNELAKKRKLAQESYKKAMTGTASQPVVAIKQPTKPQEFQFQTDGRIKSTHAMETRSDSKERDFVDSLRSRSTAKTSPQQTNHKGATIPKPFKLTDCKKRKLGSMEDLSKADTFQSMAEKVKAFHRQTPERFRSRGRVGSADKNEVHRGRSRSPNKLTHPKTPQFETKGRTRSHHIPSQQEREQEEIQEMKKNQFKAHPVNDRILTNPNTGVRKVPSKPLTHPEEFHLTTTDRRTHDSSTEDEKFEFHAKPAPKKILEGPVGIKPVKVAAATVPKSPAFALKNRVRLPSEFEESQTEPQKVKANPVPHVGVPFQPKLGHKSTVTEPFTFEERDQTVRAKKEEKIKEILEEEKKAREFQAQGFPSQTSDTLPQKQTKPPTRPQPFHFDIDTRGAKRAEEWSRKVHIEEELRQQRQQASFKATSSDILTKKPFIPAKSFKPLTDVNDFELYTDKRSKTREAYDQKRKAQEAEAEAFKRQREKRQAEQEKIAIAKLRAEMVPKSQPVKHFKTVEVLPSERPTTVPMSPKFSTDNRLRSSVRV